MSGVTTHPENEACLAFIPIWISELGTNGRYSGWTKTASELGVTCAGMVLYSVSMRAFPVIHFHSRILVILQISKFDASSMLKGLRD